MLNLVQFSGLPASPKRARVESTLLSSIALTTPIDQHILPITLQKFALLQTRVEERFLSAMVRRPIESFSKEPCFRVPSQEDFLV
jgi:hypothetical protein